MRKISSLFATALLAMLFIAGAIGCGVLDDMKSMKDTTEGMAQTTGDLNKTTDRMSESTNRLKKTTCATYLDLRQVNAFFARRNALTDLLDANDLNTKVSAAAKYLESYEFQVVKGNDLSCLPRDGTEGIITNSVAEFLLEFSQFAKAQDIRDIDVDPVLREARFQNMFALALTLHVKNMNQYNDDIDVIHQTFSMMDLLVDALSFSNAVDKEQVAYDTLPDWVKEVLQNEKKAIYVLQLRTNILIAALINEISGVNDFALLDKLIFDWWRNSGNRTWDPKFEMKKLPALKKIEMLTEAAIETKKAIQDIAIPGTTPKLDNRMRRYLNHMEKYHYKISDDKKKTINNIIKNVEMLLGERLPDKGGKP
ncbi:MAG: hypothetical protein A2Z20_09025 [Bdellovibrionales bacterium RBG_16_40_8]|nr:MAG: hypothetical protein A2Z20_09025 [Bdellovibrionales bacterium RBG_16_40_8]